MLSVKYISRKFEDRICILCWRGFFKYFVIFRFFTTISVGLAAGICNKWHSQISAGPREDFCSKRDKVCGAPWEAPSDKEEVRCPWGS